MRRLTPCETTAAVPTTAAVRATGRPTTPRRPTRPGPSGISNSLCDGFVVFGLDRSEQRLRRDAAAVDELAAGAPHRCGERAGPAVLVHEHGGDALRLERLAHCNEVLLCEEHRQRRLVRQQLADRALRHVAQLVDIDGAVL